MSGARECIAQRRAEIALLERRIALWESGRMHEYADGVDVTAARIRKLRWMIGNLELGVAILAGGAASAGQLTAPAT